VGYCYLSGLEKTHCKWDIYVPLVTKGLSVFCELFYCICMLLGFKNIGHKKMHGMSNIQ